MPLGLEFNIKIWYPALSVITLLVLAGQYSLSAIAQDGSYRGVFRQTEREIWNKYVTGASPSLWAYNIWWVINVWQAVWVIYSVLFICRRGEKGYLYDDPMFLPPTLFLCTIGQSICHIAWHFLIDRDFIVAAFIMMILKLSLLITSLVISYIALNKVVLKLYYKGRLYDVILVRVLVHNGLGLHIGWTVVVTLLHMAKVMMYEAEPAVSSETAGTSVLGPLLAISLIYVLTDFALFDRYARHTVTPYVAVLFASAAILGRIYKEEDRNSILAILIVALSGLVLLFKILVIAYIHSRPYFEEKQKLKEQEQKRNQLGQQPRQNQERQKSPQEYGLSKAVYDPAVYHGINFKK